MFRPKRKKQTTITFSLNTPASAPGSSSQSTAGVLHEKTTIRQDGATRQNRSIVSVAGEARAAVHHTLLESPHEPIYEPYTTGDHVDDPYDEDEDDGGRDLRASDDPLRQWAQDHLATFLAEMLRDEGRGDHAESSVCPRCTVSTHRQMPFHTIQRWTGSSFERQTLKDLGLRIQLGHWHSSDRVCPVPQPAPGDDFVIVDIHGTAATFSVLRRYHLLSFESKCAALEFYQSLARQTDNLHHKKDKDRYHEFLRMTRQWRNIQMLKRAARGHDPAGVMAKKPGECALLCPACPQPGINLPDGWKNVPEEKQFLYAMFLALDTNFRLKHKDVSSEQKDPGLGNGWVFYCDVVAYMEHVKRNWNQKQERSHCVVHDTVDKPDREARGTASSGIGAVDCARHNMKRPRLVGDLQLGERYLNMDYMFFYSIAGSEVLRWFVSYDIACQWHPHLMECMLKYQDETLILDGQGKFMTFLTDGEAPERRWADANPLARSTKEMGPGFRRDTLDDHFNDWNHKKIIALGYMMRRKVENAVKERGATRQALADMDASLKPQVVKEWTAMAEKWDTDINAPNPFETLRKDQHVANVRMELAAEAAARETEGREDADTVRGDMHISELIAMGLQLETQQSVGVQRRWYGFTSNTRPASRHDRAFFPALTNIHAREDEQRAHLANGMPIPGITVPNIVLWLPSAVCTAAGPDKLEIAIRASIFTMEYRLRVGQASEALHDLRRGLLVRTHLYQLKDDYSRGVRANMRSGDKIAALNDQIKRAAAAYRVARNALVGLGQEVGRDEWEWTLQHLSEEDVRGLPQARFHEPDRKKKKNKSKRARKDPRPLSWIWVNKGERWDPGDNVAMNEAVRIEWAKAHARSMRWAEEVDLLEEEMRRIGQFLQWRSDWWNAKVDLRGLPEGPQREGKTAYAKHQAAVQTRLVADFAVEWDGLAEKIRRVRVGESLGEEDDKEADEGGEVGEDNSGEDSGEEEQPITLLPHRTVKPTYVDEVLVM
ncbi:hypothetical protein B0H14DRAFT_3453348 [Mycena olivaceomarginata]|nr:hypothetical protein B0H14DRAFT_3453348 [Mycena olivaceomarginata]